MEKTPLISLGEVRGNSLYMKREDLLPFSFGGNKARKAALFFREVDAGDYDYVLSYGSGSSNHGRVVANECAKRGIPCGIICPEEASESSYNSQMMTLLGAEMWKVPVDQVRESIEEKMESLRVKGNKPFFIPGGGHGNLGTEAYVQCYEEIRQQEAEMGIHFDYIFLASGTGTTQAGLVCGQLLAGDERIIVGISIARKNPRGREVVLESIRSYMGDRVAENEIQDKTLFVDDYTRGYGDRDSRVQETINRVLRIYGIPLDPVYTGKAFMGMDEYVREIQRKNILFIHTGGTPLFFDALGQTR